MKNAPFSCHIAFYLISYKTRDNYTILSGKLQIQSELRGTANKNLQN